MDLQNFTLFAAAGSLFAFWQQIKGFIVRVFSLVIKTDEIPECGMAENFLKEILPHTKLIKWGNTVYLSEQLYFPAQKTWANLFFTYFKSYPALYKKTPIILSESGDYGLKVTYLSWTFNVRKILESVNNKGWQQCLENSKHKPDNFYIKEISGSDEILRQARMSGDNPTSVSPPVEPSGSKRGILSRSYSLMNYGDYIGLKYSDTQRGIEKEKNNSSYFWSAPAQKLDGEISFWMENRSWYRERDLAWRRGAMLFGPAGSGKTKMVIECAKKHGLPVRKLNISNMSNSEFKEAFEHENQEGQIVLMEDIDGVFNFRENILASSTHTKQLLSFDTFINAIGGIRAANGSFVIVTSNHPDKLDPAMVRSGRIDAHIEVGPLCREGRLFVAKNILRDWPNLVDKIVDECEDTVAAEFENQCIELAIQEKNKELA